MKVIEERDGKKLVSVMEGGRTVRKWVDGSAKKTAKKKAAKKKASKK